MAAFCNYDEDNLLTVVSNITLRLWVPEYGEDARRLELATVWIDRLRRMIAEVDDPRYDALAMTLGKTPPPEFPADYNDRFRALKTAVEAVDCYLRMKITGAERPNWDKIVRALHQREEHRRGAEARSLAKIRADVDRFLPICHFILARRYLPENLLSDGERPWIPHPPFLREAFHLEWFRLAESLRQIIIKERLLTAAESHFIAGIEPNITDLAEIPGLRDGLSPRMDAWLAETPNVSSSKYSGKPAPSKGRSKRGGIAKYADRDLIRLLSMWGHGDGFGNKTRDFVEAMFGELPTAFREGLDDLEFEEQIGIVTDRVKKALDAARKRRKNGRLQSLSAGTGHR